MYARPVKKKRTNPVHPGEVLIEEFLKPMNLSQNALARSLGVPPRRINEIVHRRRRLTADTALRLARFFRMSLEFWMGLQMDYELDVESDRLAGRLETEVEECRKASERTIGHGLPAVRCGKVGHSGKFAVRQNEPETFDSLSRCG